jgi:hypothetical protein
METHTPVGGFDETQALTEGWSIFECWGSDNGPFQLQRVDEDEVFTRDDEAWAFVVGKAREGSAYHKAALDFLRANNPIEIASMTKVHGELP